MHQEEHADEQPNQPGEERSLGWAGIGHGWSASRTLPLVDVWIRRCRRCSGWGGRNWTANVSIGRGQGTCQADQANDDQNHRPGVAERQITAAQLVQEKQNADRDDNRRAHEAANHATAAIAANAITHRNSSFSPKNAVRTDCETSKCLRRSTPTAKDARSARKGTSQNCSAEIERPRRSKSLVRQGDFCSKTRADRRESPLDFVP